MCLGVLYMGGKESKKSQILSVDRNLDVKQGV